MSWQAAPYLMYGDREVQQREASHLCALYTFYTSHLCALTTYLVAEKPQLAELAIHLEALGKLPSAEGPDAALLQAQRGKALRGTRGRCKV